MNQYYLNTEKRIQTAFLDLRRTCDISKLSVRALCDCAEINKSTFYYHYQDIYHLAHTMERNCVEALFHRLLSDTDSSIAHQEAVNQQLLAEFSQPLGTLFSGQKDRFYATVNDLFSEVITDDRLTEQDRIRTAIALQRVITLFHRATTATPNAQLFTAHEQLFSTLLTAVEQLPARCYTNYQL